MIKSTVNKDFRIKVNGYHRGKYISKLVGIRGLVYIIGVDLAEKMIARAYRSRKQKVICKLRRGIKITFYAK
jgi:hypothetical protein